MVFRVFIGKLTFFLDEKTFGEELKKVGITGFSETNYVKRFGKFKGYAFASFEKEEDAKKAIANANGKSIGERVIKVENAYDDKAIEEKKEARARTLFVGNLDPKVKEADMQNIFAGRKIVSSKILKKKKSDDLIAFVTFESKEEAEQALADVKGTKVEGQTIKVDKVLGPRRRSRPKRKAKGAKPKSGKGEAKPKKEAKPRKPRVPLSERVKDALVVYVGNISFKATSEDLIAYFKDYTPKDGRVVRVGRDHGRSKGFGFVEFANEESAKKALALNDTEMMGRKIKCSIAYKRIEETPKTD